MIHRTDTLILKRAKAIIWNAATGEKIRTLAGNVHQAAWSPDGKSLVTGSWDNTAIIWNPATGVKLCTLVGHTDNVYEATWSPDGRSIITCSSDFSRRIWDVEACKELVALYIFDDGKDWLTVTPEGYFDGSVNGSKYLRYRIKGTNDHVPLERYREKFEVPGLLTKIFKGEPIAKSGEIVKLDLPPLGKLLSPIIKSEIKQSKLTVKASAASRGQ